MTINDSTSNDVFLLLHFIRDELTNDLSRELSYIYPTIKYMFVQYEPIQKLIKYFIRNHVTEVNP